MSLFVLMGLGAGFGWLGWRFLFGSKRTTGRAGLAEAVLCIGLAGAAPVWAAGQVAPNSSLHFLATLWIWIALALSLCDARVLRLPDLLTLALLATALGFVWLHPTRDLGAAVLAAVLSVAAFWLLQVLYLLRTGRVGIGLGDVKLIAGLSAMVGLSHLPWVTMLAALAAGMITVALTRLRGQSSASSLSQVPVPFGLYLCVTSIWVWGVL